MRCNIPTRDLAQKLDGTVCRYDGFPVFVRVDGNTLYLYHVSNTNKIFRQLTSAEVKDSPFDISGVPLGYVQFKSQVYYLVRMTPRRTKQGLDTRAVRVKSLIDQQSPKSYGITSNSVIFQQGFEDMVLNKYPNLNTAIESIRREHAKDPKGLAQVAISRNIAMYIDEMARVNIFYKEEFVGWMQPDKFTVHVPSSDKSWIISKYLSHELSWTVD